tara:strand:+ start:823 stop:1878 length:1056 start_codon:yes stop_codon:yes gene_type:complete
MAQIDKPNLHFRTKLYTGNGGTQSITGVGFQPDWVWTKYRNDTYGHRLMDSVRGATKEIYSNNDGAETTTATGLTSFDSDGFTLGSSSGVNHNTGTYVSWNWKAGGSGSSNSDGATASTVSVNSTSKFSIVKFTGTGSATTVGHGLGVAPNTIFFKNLIDENDWFVYSSAMGFAMTTPDPETDYMKLNQVNARTDDASAFNDTAPTNSVFSVGNASNVNGSGDACIAYCFTDVKGYCKSGGYIGNHNADGPFVYTGFKPAFVIIKAINYSSQNWNIYDNKRPGYNVITNHVYANTSGTEITSGANQIDFLSNGFKCRASNDGSNRGSEYYMYMAIAENPIVGSNNIPATAI